ncbi:hypothetical protein J2X68_007585 [Streptomyces sp. 3330]|uniref:tetratricopeptide repeat protein n=1 Tax=Streptomyces sp. 3330 TaxID=2817755 RepID=UPI0028543327|nr:hypothetical protein [Streptomyces sp. 3330]MDR6980843.1 hypothetical protein [Streptomyces sp. 3330]
MRHTAETMAQEGHLDEAMAWFETAARAGDDSSLVAAAEALADGGRLTQALPWFDQAAAAGNEDALAEAAEYLQDAGRVDEAFAWGKRAEREGPGVVRTPLPGMSARTIKAVRPSSLVDGRPLYGLSAVTGIPHTLHGPMGLPGLSERFLRGRRAERRRTPTA